MNDNHKISRRNFIKNSALTIGSISVLSGILNNREAVAQASALVDEASPTAAALGYKQDASLVDIVKYPKRATPESKKEFCLNCMFSSQGGQKIEGKDGTWAKCTLFPIGLVNEHGWCNSWTLRPGTTL